jgi:transcriptional antiterminator RfaH
MYIGDTADIPCWYALRTHPQQEERANSNLLAWGVETFSPRIKERRLNPFTGAPTSITKPLFPRYIFARFKAHSLLHKVCFTRGVQSVVSFGGKPTVIDDDIIKFIEAQVDVDGFVKIGEELKYGDSVQIKDGPFKSLTGMFERKAKDSDRVMILLTTINYQGRIMVERQQVARIA